ncbi:MAG: hypothetical protein SF182_07395 [Deltaproteobacteria bacterium]|nr:hypothetical protein [Deltaproteobacteria bacterium]
MTWQDIYASELQAVWALQVVPLLYLAWRALLAAPVEWRPATVEGRLAWFVDRYAIVFALETILDPLATTPLLNALGIAGQPAGTAVMIAFVLLGDFRVYLLVFALLALAAGQTWRVALPRAAAWTLLVPAIAVPLDAALRVAAPGRDPNSIWLVYESVFTLVALGLRTRLAGAPPLVRDALRAVLAYVALYYALWASSDVLIQLLGLDAGWLLRIVPNQLYYAFWIPFVVWRCGKRNPQMNTENHR